MKHDSWDILRVLSKCIHNIIKGLGWKILAVSYMSTNVIVIPHIDNEIIFMRRLVRVLDYIS